MSLQKNDLQSLPRKFSFFAAGERRRQASWNGERCRGSHFSSVYPGRKWKNAFSGKQYKYADSGVFVEYDFSRFIGGYSGWMFIPFDILVFALGACSKERLSNSFYKSSSLCCRRTNTQLLHIYILVPALGGAWKVEQPLEALPSSLHPVHWFFTFLLSSYTKKNRIIFVFLNRQSDSSGQAGGAWRTGGDPQNLWTCSDRKSPGESPFVPFVVIWSFVQQSFIHWEIDTCRRPTSFCLFGVHGLFGFSLTSPYCRLLFCSSCFSNLKSGQKWESKTVPISKIPLLRLQNFFNVDSAQEQELRQWTCRSWTERKCLQKTWPANISKCSRVGRSSSSTAGDGWPSLLKLENCSFLHQTKTNKHC